MFDTDFCLLWRGEEVVWEDGWVDIVGVVDLLKGLGDGIVVA